ncbi:hypothetical protein [Nocardia transvalensis]|uniref:hypothetical protein n=1 Tax=Nocardia transvalensis TaxID=37333 RepID=UPI0018956D1D|nr:hypothetical protein [Nocardia transvalensis]MBF6328367.1 hypothetical protein [Nocardia transvalensis]
MTTDHNPDPPGPVADSEPTYGGASRTGEHTQQPTNPSQRTSPPTPDEDVAPDPVRPAQAESVLGAPGRDADAARTPDTRSAPSHVGATSVSESTQDPHTAPTTDTETGAGHPGAASVPVPAPGQDPGTAHSFDTEASLHAGGVAEDDAPLLDPGELERLRIRWREAQAMFVDNPREAVARADELVTATLDQLADSYADRRKALQNRWSADECDTETRRRALRTYRTFFDHLLGPAR